MHDQKRIKRNKDSNWVVKVVICDTTDSDASIVQYATRRSYTALKRSKKWCNIVLSQNHLGCSTLCLCTMYFSLESWAIFNDLDALKSGVAF